MAADFQLEVEDLRFRYGSREAVAGVSFAVRPGEIFGFLGPNGAGKTTAISCVCGLLGGWQGAMRFGGETFRPDLRAADRRRIGLVPQDLAVYEELSGRENLLFFGRLVGLAGAELTAAVERALELTGLGERADDRVGSYSGGMKRRLNLAAGDLHRPSLLILDEPTVGVDPQSRNHIFAALERLRDQGRTLLYTTHYMEEAERLCDRIAVLDRGRLIGLGAAAELAEQAGVPGADLEQVFLRLTGHRLRDSA
ncbi:MAG: ABC transporter ATP-binding protein [Planctomycetota bacterium]|nr:MAG: ABC transporter ATP-binding protein [Planctomycetota bacterium]